MRAVAIILLLVASTMAADLNEKRGIIDFAMNTFGLGKVWDTITSLSSSVYNNFTGTISRLLFAGQTAWANARPILGQLVTDLSNHAGDAVSIVTQATSQLTNVLAQSGKRSITDFIVNSFGLSAIMDSVKEAGGNLLTNLQNTLASLLFAGGQAWNSARPILSQLVSDITNHVGNTGQLVNNAVSQLSAVISNGNNGGKRAVFDFVINSFGLGGVWDSITSVGGNVLSRFQAALTQLLFAGKRAWDAAKPIFVKLVSDIVNHVGTTASLLTQATTDLYNVLTQNGKRELMESRRDVADFLLNSFGLSAVADALKEAGTVVYQQLQSVLMGLLFQGQNAWSQAQVVFSQLANDLTNHAGNAGQLVQNALAQLSGQFGGY